MGCPGSRRAATSSFPAGRSRWARTTRGPTTTSGRRTSVDAAAVPDRPRTRDERASTPRSSKPTGAAAPLAAGRRARTERGGQHVSFHEAEAYARWAGKRLPTEAGVGEGGEDRRRGARARAAAPSGSGRRPSSTATRASAPSRTSEYSEVFFGDEYRVLRGGSWVTDPLVARPTFRNWDLPQRRQIFAGIRCASDV